MGQIWIWIGADIESAPTVLTDMNGAGVGAESISALISNGADMNGADLDLDWGGYRIRPYLSNPNLSNRYLMDLRLMPSSSAALFLLLSETSNAFFI